MGPLQLQTKIFPLGNTRGCRIGQPSTALWGFIVKTCFFCLILADTTEKVNFQSWSQRRGTMQRAISQYCHLNPRINLTTCSIDLHCLIEQPEGFCSSCSDCSQPSTRSCIYIHGGSRLGTYSYNRLLSELLKLTWVGINVIYLSCGEGKPHADHAKSKSGVEGYGQIGECFGEALGVVRVYYALEPCGVSRHRDIVEPDGGKSKIPRLKQSTRSKATSSKANRDLQTLSRVRIHAYRLVVCLDKLISLPRSYENMNDLMVKMFLDAEIFPELRVVQVKTGVGNTETGYLLVREGAPQSLKLNKPYGSASSGEMDRWTK